MAGNITQTLAAASPQERIPLPPVYPHSGEGISLRHWLLPHLRGEYDSLLYILTAAGNITQTLAAASPEERIPLPPVYPHSGEGISLRHWLLSHLRRQYHSLLSILTQGTEYHSDTGCCLTSGENTTPSCLSSLSSGNITQTLAAASPQETIPLPPAYPHCGREYHSDTGCCLTSRENTTPSCLSSLGGGNITQTLAAASPQERIPLPPVYPHCGREYHSDTFCCLTSRENTTPSYLSSLGEGISLRHWLLPHLRRQCHSLLSILTRGGNITQTLAAALPQERIRLPPVYPHCGREYHSDTGCCLTSRENTTPSCLSSLGGGNITQTLAAESPQGRIRLPPVYPHCGREYHSDTGCCLTSRENTTPSCLSSLGEGISLRHWLLPHLSRQYHSLLSILTRGGNITQTLAAASPQERISLPPAYPHSGQGISLRHWLLPHLRRQYHSLLSIVTGGRNITQTLAAASPQETIPLPPAYPHSGQGISLRHWLLPHLKTEYHSLLPILTVAGNITQTLAAASPQWSEYHSLLSIVTRGGNITQTLAAASPQETIPLPIAYPHSVCEYHSDTGGCLTSVERIPLPPVYRHSGEGISLRHWLLPHLIRQYHSLLPILTADREYHSDTGCCLTSGDNTTPYCLSSLGVGISLRHWLLPHLSGANTTPSCLSSLGGGNITQTLAAVSPQ